MLIWIARSDFRGFPVKATRMKPASQTAAQLVATIEALPVFDTHSHLNAPGRALGARGFHDLGYYFWLSQQMQGVGWREPEELTEETACAYFDAFVQTQNTAMNWCLRRILLDLYQIELNRPQDILAADKMIRERAGFSSHVQEVCQKGHLRQIVQNLESRAGFSDAPGLDVLVADTLNAPVETCLQYPSDASVRQAASVLRRTVDAMAKAGRRGARIDYNLFETLEVEGWRSTLLDAVFSRLHHHGMFVQIFMGMKREPRGSFPQDHPRRITTLYPFFRAYPDCRFELVCAAEGNSLDVVQAAVANPNVNPGGLWWYTFRPSIYRQALQQRLEAVAPLKCPVLASDATCVEWCYGKTMLVKKLVSEVLVRNVEEGWISEDCAIRTASAWLHDAAASYYT
jgi:glucuronate isomerase